MTYTITQLVTGKNVRNDYQISSNNSALWVEDNALKFYNGQNTRTLEASGGSLGGFFDPQLSNGKAVWMKYVDEIRSGSSFPTPHVFLFDGSNIVDLGSTLSSSGNGPTITIEGDRVAYATREGVTVYNISTGTRSIIPGSTTGTYGADASKVTNIKLDPASNAVIWNDINSGLISGLKMYDGNQIVTIPNAGGKAEIYNQRILSENITYKYVNGLPYSTSSIGLYSDGINSTVAENLGSLVEPYGGSYGLNDTTVFFQADEILKNYDIATGVTTTVAENSGFSNSYGNGQYRAWQSGKSIVLSEGQATIPTSLVVSDGSTQTTIATSNTLAIPSFEPAVGADGSILFQQGGNLYLATNGSVPNPTTNQAPTVAANAIDDQTATIGTAFSFAVPTNAFSDPNPGDTLTYSATLADGSPRPAWLAFDSATRTFSGTPPTGTSNLNLLVKATDNGNLSVTDEFALTIAAGGSGGGGTGGGGGTTGGGSTLVPGLSLTSNLFQTDATFKGFGITPISQKLTQKVSEIALFAVDDLSGNIGGIAPGSPGYLAAALNNAKSIFSTLGGSFFSANKRELSLDPNKIYQALEIVDGSILDAQQQLASGKTPNNLLFSFPDGSGNSPIKITNTANGFNLSINNDELVLGIDKLAGSVVNTPIGAKSQSAPGGRTIDLSDYAGQTLKADLVTNSSAAYNNQVGFYAVEDASGKIKLGDGSTLNPGDANYAVEAIKLALTNSLQAGKTDTLMGRDIVGGQIYAPVVVSQGTFNDFVTKNPTNGGGANDIHAYFNYLGANADKVDHFRLLGNNTFGVEDMYGGGDRDFNDLVIKMDIKV